MLHLIENALFRDLVLGTQVLNGFEFASELFVPFDASLQILTELICINDQLLLPHLQLVILCCQVFEVLLQFFLPSRLCEVALLDLAVCLVCISLLALKLELLVLELS